MSGFSAEWLALREPADAAARSVDVLRLVLESLRTRAQCRVVDLGCGTGSNVRALAPALPTPQQWRLVDHDPALLAVAATRAGVVAERLPMDLRDLHDEAFADRDLVTASALLDLVSDDWLVRFARQCWRAQAAVLVVLNYDGRLACSPRDPDDDLVRDLVNAHQRTDKGFGPALGPDAGARVEQLLREAGYITRRAPSDWVLGPSQAELQRQLIGGWAAAASERAGAERARIRAWEQRRLANVDAGRSRLIVGHDDVGAVVGLDAAAD
jgi:SAM-dependent methyltransferase